ncbi:MAG: aminotransferase class I/II-fold pyridoxal phosphate-dependent enzyme [Patescibacteria group bacterium]|nr:aminotransferase class I/II-fold pyridoxal phosphate-dependent enzyme [Patescibacteria group bacterium]
MKLNRTIERISESETLHLNALVKALARKGKKVFNFTAGELDFATPESIRRRVVRHLSENKYTPVLGLSILRRAIAARAAKDYGAKDISDKDVAVTAGAKQGLAEVLQVILNHDDEVIIPTPAWPTYAEQVRLFGGRPVLVPLSKNFELDIAAVKAALTSKTKAIILNFPHNPTGKIFSESALRRLAKVLQHRRVYVIADVIYRALVYDGKMPKPAKIFKKNLIIIDGFSKSHALTGWRIGHMVAEPVIISALGRLQSQTSGNASIVSQHAALAALGASAVTAEFLRALSRRRKFVAEALAKITSINFVLPDGAFYFFLDIRKINRDSQEFCRELLQKTGVALVPGETFAAPGFARLSFAAPDAALEEGLQRLAKFVKL